MTVPFAKIDYVDGVYIGYVKGVEITRAATAKKCSDKLSKYVKSQSPS